MIGAQLSSVFRAEDVIAKRYRVLQRLGGGSVGDVYVAEHLSLGSRFALKVLRTDVATSPGIRQLFEQEAQIAASIGCRHIVHVFDSGVDERTGSPFFVMELLEGCDLQSYAEGCGPLPVHEVAEIIGQVAQGLDTAHTHVDRLGQLCPIVHRDLKPENLFLTRDEDGKFLVKILDFGVAKILRDANVRTQAIRGTPLYCAPEQYELVVVPQSDLWALGLITFFLLTGEHYWNSIRSTAGSSESLMHETLLAPLTPPSRRLLERGQRRALPAGFDGWFARCVNREPAQRFQTAGEAARALLQLIASEIVAGSRSSAAQSPTGADGPTKIAATAKLTESGRRPMLRRSSWLVLSLVGTATFLGTLGLMSVFRSRAPARAPVTTASVLGTGSEFVVGQTGPTPAVIEERSHKESLQQASNTQPQRALNRSVQPISTSSHLAARLSAKPIASPLAPLQRVALAAVKPAEEQSREPPTTAVALLNFRGLAPQSLTSGGTVSWFRGESSRIPSRAANSSGSKPANPEIVRDPYEF